MSMTLRDRYAKHVHIKVRFDELHPKCSDAFLTLGWEMVAAFDREETNDLFLPFEGYRNPLNQLLLLRQQTTRAKPFQSAHNYGMAVDFVKVRRDSITTDNTRGLGWTWSDRTPAEKADWTVLHQKAKDCGLLAPITWDKPHIVHPLWNAIKDAVV